MRLNRFGTASLVIGLTAVAAVACSFIADTDAVQCNSTADCIKRGKGFEGLVCSGGVCVREGGCSTNAECVDTHGGQPWICNKATRDCVNLQLDLAAVDGGSASADGGAGAPCTPYMSEGDIRNDETIWIGLLTSTKGTWGGTFGAEHLNFTELARRQISEKNAGLPPATVGGKVRPLAFVHCEINDSPEEGVRAAKYLVEKAGFKFFMGGDQPSTFLKMTQEVFVPAKVMNLSLIGSGVAVIPPTDPLLIYELGASLLNLKASSLGFFPILEAEARRRFGLKPEEDIRLSFVTNSSLFTKGLADQVQPALRINNKDIVTNGPSRYQRIQVNEFATPAEYDQAVKDVVDFNPHVVLLLGFSEMSDVILPKVDRGLTQGGKKGPTIGTTVLSLTKGLITEGSLRPELQSRVLWLGPDFASAGAKYMAVNDYPAAFPNAAPLDPVLKGLVAIPYDIFYLYAYAIAANGANPLTPENLGRAIPKLFDRNGKHIETGTDQLFEGFQSLAPSGPGSIWLKGKLAFRDGDDHVDMDLAAGWTPYWPYKIYCPISNEAAGGIIKGGDPRLMVSGQESGYSYQYPDLGAIKGSLRPECLIYEDKGDVGTADAGADGG